MRAILTYHSVDPSGSVISVDEDVLRRHADWLASGAVRVVSVGELFELDDAEEAVAITFDDGFENFGQIAWPILAERGLPATVFVVAGHVGGHNDWGGAPAAGVPQLPLMDWAALGQLAEAGVSVGGHTMLHPRLAGMPRDRVEAEVAGCAEAIEREIGVRPEGFAYPYGSCDEQAVEVAEASYAWACTTELTPVGPSADRHRLPRLDAYYYRRPGQLERWGTVGFKARLALRGAARTLRGQTMGVAG